jgi:hypothetical protein
MNPVHSTPFYLSKILFNIILSYMSKFSIGPVLLVFIPSFNGCYMPCPLNHPLLHHANFAKRASYEGHHYAILSDLILLHPSWILIFPSVPCPQIRSYLNVRDHTSHRYKTTGKIIILYVLIFMFLESRREDSRL